MKALRRLLSAIAAPTSGWRPIILEARPFVPMWDHLCEREGALSIAAGEPCNWCGAEQPKA